MTFEEIGIIEPILKSLRELGYQNPTPIQEQSIPILLEGKDLLGCAQTGTGKTAAFAIPIIQHLSLNRKQERKRKVRALVVTPTRELAIQIGDSFSEYGRYTGIRNTVIFGGVKQGSQTNALSKGVDIIVATPGRLLDLMNQGYISLKNIEYFVLDEADHMLDMGFIHDIRKLIAKIPVKRQSLFFSATMPPSIINLAGKILGTPEKVTIKPQQATAERVEQAVYYVSKKNKPKLLLHILEETSANSTLVFSRTKYGADKIVKVLRRNDIVAEAIHGNKSQNARQKALKNFKKGDTTVLVATDIAARGIDVDELSLVVNFDLPNVPETYVHRIGRTGRASASGIALSFCMMEERPYLRDIQKLIKQTLPLREDHPFPDEGEESEGQPKKKQSNNNRRRNPNNSSQSRRRSQSWGGKKKNRDRRD